LEPLTIKESRFLSRLEGFSVSQCKHYLSEGVNESSLEDRTFAKKLQAAIQLITEEIPEPFFKSAIFSARAIRAPGLALGDGLKGLATVYAFCIIPDVHGASIKSADNLTYIPFSFFKCSQRVYKHSPDHAILARRIHKEFSAILAQRENANAHERQERHGSLSETHLTKKQSKLWPFSKHSSARSSMVESKPDFSSQNELVGFHGRDSDEPMSSAHPFGGIMVSSDVTIEDHRTKGDTQLEMKEMGLRTEAGIAAMEQPTYADELFRMASSRWQQR